MENKKIVISIVVMIFFHGYSIGSEKEWREHKPLPLPGFVSPSNREQSKAAMPVVCDHTELIVESEDTLFHSLDNHVATVKKIKLRPEKCKEDMIVYKAIVEVDNLRIKGEHICRLKGHGKKDYNKFFPEKVLEPAEKKKEKDTKSEGSSKEVLAPPAEQKAPPIMSPKPSPKSVLLILEELKKKRNKKASPKGFDSVAPK